MRVIRVAMKPSLDDGTRYVSVTFEHDGAPGSPPQRVELPLAEFASTWEALPQSNHIELRAAS